MFKYLSICLLILTGTTHESFMSMEYSAEKEIFKVFIKMSYNDFIRDYRNSVNDDQAFDLSGKIDTTVILVNKYINNKVQIYEENIRLNGHTDAINYSEGFLHINLTYRKNKKSNRWLVRNTILSDVYPDQANYMIFKHGDYEEGVVFTREKPEKSFKLK